MRATLLTFVVHRFATNTAIQEASRQQFFAEISTLMEVVCVFGQLHLDGIPHFSADGRITDQVRNFDTDWVRMCLLSADEIFLFVLHPLAFIGRPKSGLITNPPFRA